MTDAKKILDMAMEKPFSEFCFNIIQFQNSHTELMVTSYLPYVKLFEDHLESLCKNIQELNLSKGELEESHAVQALFLVRVPRMRIPLIPPSDSEGIRHGVPIESAMQIRLIPPPPVGA